MMCKKLLMLVLVLALASSASAYWLGAASSDWSNGANWGSGIVPVSGEWVDVRSDTWYGNFPEVSTGVTALAGTIRMNPGYGPETPTITMSGGTLTTSGEIYIGNSGGPADFIMNSGTVNVAAGSFTAVGNLGGKGRLYVNGGIMNAGFLGTPNWYDGGIGTGEIYIDGGDLNTIGFLVGVGGNIDFTKDLADGGGLLTDIQDLDNLDWADFQAGVLGYVGSGLISSSAGGGIQVDFSAVGTIRTTEIYSVPEPMTMVLLGVGSLLLRRRSK
jgi:hypothetical protein